MEITESDCIGLEQFLKDNFRIPITNCFVDGKLKDVQYKGRWAIMTLFSWKKYGDFSKGFKIGMLKNM